MLFDTTEMKIFYSLALLFVLTYINCVPVPPAHKAPNIDPKEGDVPQQEEIDLQLEYQRYLKEVVDALEKDEKFSKQLSEANSSDIKSGEIAKHLDFVDHGIRSKLDEIKRREMERLRTVAREKMRLANGVGKFGPMDPSHLHHDNPHTFEIEDLQKLIKSATSDLEKHDTERKKEFKHYEMEKEHLRREKFKGMDEDHRKQEQLKFDQQQKKHKDHPKLLHPGSEDQLKEVWEKNDHMDKEDFNPKTFFQMHDVNQDGYLEIDEVEALFQTELDKAYDPNATEDDMEERYEEMNRMREHVMKEVDKDKDGLVSLDEFMQETKDRDFKKDEGWKTIDEEEPYTDDEFKGFEEDWKKEHAQPGEINIPPHPNQHQQPPEEHQPKAAHQQDLHPPQMAHNREQEQQIHGGNVNQQQVPHMNQQQAAVEQHRQPPPPQQAQEHQQPPQGQEHQGPPHDQEHQQPPQGQDQQKHQQDQGQRHI